MHFDAEFFVTIGFILFVAILLYAGAHRRGVGALDARSNRVAAELSEAKRLREYLLKGGFLMVDDFHGTQDWENFMSGLRQVLPDRPIEDLASGDEIFHTLYDVDDKIQIPGEQWIRSGRTYEKDGYQPKWRAIRDDKGRIVVAICHNMHLGDAWEWADDPNYPEQFASAAFRVGLDYILYGMTH